MVFDRWLRTFLARAGSLYYKLTIVFALFFLAPVAALLYFAVAYDLLNEPALAYFFILLLFFSLAGFLFLRIIFDRVASISRDMRQRLPLPLRSESGDRQADEVDDIAEFAAAMERRLHDLHGDLEKKVSEFSLLRELSDLCYVTLDPDELLYVTLERALKLADADRGSVMLLDRTDRRRFIIKACIGLGEEAATGDSVDYATSIAKYAVINKSPLVVDNIETDSRFGRINRPQYGSKSFICMPIKTIGDIIGVLTIARRAGDTPFSTGQADSIAPLISNAAFTFENLRLTKERDDHSRLFHILDRVCSIIGSSFRENEVVRSVLHEVRHETGYSRAALLLLHENHPDNLILYEFHEPEGGAGFQPPAAEAVFSARFGPFERVLKGGASLVCDDPSVYPSSSERDLLGEPGADPTLLIPLYNDGRTAGILLLCGMNRGALPRIRSFLEQVGSILALVLVKGTLLERVVQRNSELAALKRIGGALASSTFDMSQVLSYTMDLIRGTMNVEAGSLLLVRDDELEFTVAFGMNLDDMRSRRLKQGEGIAGYVATRGETVVVNDIASSRLFNDQTYEMLHFRTTSVLAVPLISQGQVIGVLEVLNKMTGDFIDDNLRLLQSIASSVSIALENARLYDETRSMAEHEREVRRIFQKFVPKEIVDKIMHGSEADLKLHDEFRTLTLLNVDIRGFSDMARRVGPQKTVSLLNHFFSVMGEIVFKHDGIVDKYLGDGFLALFGAPVSGAYDADNALRAAVEMREALLVLNERFVTEARAALNVGISIHTGEVVVGNIGFEKKMDYTVIGDSVNAVFRIQGLTKEYANGILISEMTRRATRSNFELREAGKHDIGVMTGEISIYEVLSPAPGMDI